MSSGVVRVNETAKAQSAGEHGGSDCVCVSARRVVPVEPVRGMSRGIGLHPGPGGPVADRAARPSVDKSCRGGVETIDGSAAQQPGGAAGSASREAAHWTMRTPSSGRLISSGAAVAAGRRRQRCWSWRGSSGVCTGWVCLRWRSWSESSGSGMRTTFTPGRSGFSTSAMRCSRGGPGRSSSSGGDALG